MVTQAPTVAMAEGNRWFKVTDVVRITSMSRSKIYQLMDAGTLKSKKVGGSRRITELDLAEFMASFDGNGPIDSAAVAS